MLLIQAVSLPAWCQNQGHRTQPIDDTLDIIFMVVMDIVVAVSYALLLWWPTDALIHWRSRWDRLRSNPQATRYSSNAACRIAISVCVLILCAAAAWYLVSHKILTAAFWDHYYPDFKIYFLLLPMQWAIVLLFADAIILSLLSYLTIHICITEDGVNFESVVCGSNTGGISWDHLTWVEVRKSSRNLSGILKVALHGKIGKRESRIITIPGHHPAVKQMLEVIRVHAPDKFEPPPKKVTVVPPRVKFMRVLAMIYLVVIMAVVISANWLLHAYPKSMTVKLLWSVTLSMVIVVGCLQQIAALVYTYTAYKHRSSPLAAHEYALAEDRSYKIRAYVVYAVVVIITLSYAFGIYLTGISHSHNGRYLFAVLLVGFLIPIVMGAEWLITKLSARVCITDERICVKTAKTSEDREGISWKYLTGLDVQTSHHSPSGIRRVVVRGGNDKWSKSSITIPGSHPDIQRILQDIREHAPDMVAKTLLGQ